jgi:hypothetical protein
MRPLCCAVPADALAMSRRWNVEQGSLFETPTFEWLDANETKETEFALCLRLLGEGEASPSGEVMCYSGGASS